MTLVEVMLEDKDLKEKADDLLGDFVLFFDEYIKDVWQVIILLYYFYWFFINDNFLK